MTVKSKWAPLLLSVAVATAGVACSRDEARQSPAPATAQTSNEAQSPVAPGLPPRNPYLANSHWPITHGDVASTDAPRVRGPVGPSRTLSKDEVQWKKLGPIQSWEVTYSSPYPNGERVMWTGGYDRIVKVDADTLETLAELRLEGKGIHYWTDEEIDEFVDKVDSLKGQPLYDLVQDTFVPLFPTAGSNYRFQASNNELYVPISPIGPGNQFLGVYGDVDPTDPRSPIELKRKWEIPESIAPNTKACGLSMTYDGWIIMVTYSGVMFAISRDFSEYHSIQLPGSGDANMDFFSAFVRNGPAIDDEGGIYVVSEKYMQRVQWTGEKLSLDEEDGAWVVPYDVDPPKGKLPVGSGTNPVLMGFNDGADKLVAIGDGKYRSSIVLYWRDDIPEDWQGLPGHPRRVAGTLPMHYGDDSQEVIHTESSPLVMGYGIFIANTEPGAIPEQRSPLGQFLSANYAITEPGHLPHGVMKGEWNPKTRKLEMAYVNPKISCTGSIATASSHPATPLAYCIGYRDNSWTLEGIDWESGDSAFHYKLGESHRYNILGGVIRVHDDGEALCSCPGGMGIVKIAPKPESERKPAPEPEDVSQTQ